MGSLAQTHFTKNQNRKETFLAQDGKKAYSPPDGKPLPKLMVCNKALRVAEYLQGNF
jgi:hypothetical protein